MKTKYTHIVSFDTIHDPRYLMVNRRDLNGTVRADRELGDLLLQAAEEIGVKDKNGQVPLFGGSTDSAAFTQGSFRSVGITGFNRKLEDYYHTCRDTYDNLNAEGLEQCYRATVSFLGKMDMKGCGTPEMTKRSKYMDEAYRLGKKQ